MSRNFYGTSGFEVATDIPTEEDFQHERATLIERESLPNLHKVSEELYRGAQPTAEGMQELKKLGIKR